VVVTTQRHPPYDGTRWWVRGCLIILAVLGGAAGVYTLAVVPPTPDSWYPGCQLYTFTGLHCPGCGTTRAVHALLNGRLAQALAYNPLAFIILPVVSWSIVRSLWTSRRPSTQTDDAPRNRLLPWLLGAGLLLYAVLRNIPVHPFTLLAPHEV
jgi:hypothetical protein